MRSMVLLIYAGIALVLGLYAYRKYWSALSEIPVVKGLSDSYESGILAISEVSRHAVQKFYSGDLVESVSTTKILQKASGSSEDKIRIHSTWDRGKILSNLKNSGFKGKKLDNAARYVKYIDQYKDIALRDMYHKKIPASIKLAQGLLESGAGESLLARKTNNHFGIKARATRSGRKKIREKKIHLLTDEDFTTHPMATGVYNFSDDHKYDRFEVHRSVPDSYNRHTRLLTRPCRSGKGCYAWIWDTYQVGKTYKVEESFYGDKEVSYYAACAAALKKAGYATDKNYHHKLVSLIGTYELWRFDVDLVNTLAKM